MNTINLIAHFNLLIHLIVMLYHLLFINVFFLIIPIIIMRISKGY